MAERIAIIGGERYADWIKRDGKAQRLFKAYRSQWPDGDTRCVAVGNELYVRLSNVDEMRRVYNTGDFDNEEEWCSQCGTPIDSDDGDHYSCDEYDRHAVPCDHCGGSLTCDGYYCPQHRGAEAFTDSKEPSYVYPYASDSRNMVDAWIESGYNNSVFDRQGHVALITPTAVWNGLRASRLNSHAAYGCLTCGGMSNEFFGRVVRRALIS